MRDFLRFVFSDGDQEHLDLAATSVLDVPWDGSVATDLYPMAMRISCTYDTATAPGIPQVRPLFPGFLRFIAATDVPGFLPEPSQVVVNPTTTEYEDWITEGTIVIRRYQSAKKRTYLDDLGYSLGEIESDMTGHLPILPTHVWYSRVKISRDFLFTTLISDLEKADVESGGGVAKPTDADWEQHAIAQFLAGRYQPEVRLGVDAAEDDVAASAMPEVVSDASGSFDLDVACAHTRKPQDAARSAFDDLDEAAGKDLWMPDHPQHGVLPARHVFRSLSSIMIDSSTVWAIADLILADWPDAPRFHLVTCTRTFDNVYQNCSVHFPTQTARFTKWSDNTLLQECPVPAHGLVYLLEDPAAVASKPRVNFIIDGGWRYLDADSRSDIWRAMGKTSGLDIDFEANDYPHVQLRRPMKEEMMVEPFWRPGGARCTYMSMRRTVRAWVDNRICGGRLSHGVTGTSQQTLNIMDSAFSSAAGVSGADFAANSPSPTADPNDAYILFGPVLRAFFPDTAAKKSGAPATATDLIEGDVAYWIWQSVIVQFQAADTQWSFPDEHIGRGGPGAVVYLGLADYAVGDSRIGAESDDAWTQRNTDEFLNDTVEQGATIQFWVKNTEFESIKDRTAPTEPETILGHSPVFFGYVGSSGAYTAIEVVDQGAGQQTPGDPTECEVRTTESPQRIRWHGMTLDIWLAANWIE